MQKPCVVALQWGEKVRNLRKKITLNASHLPLCGSGQRPAGPINTHTLTHTPPARIASSEPWSFSGNLEGQNNDFHNVFLQWREKKVWEEREHFPSRTVGVLLSLALRELLVLAATYWLSSHVGSVAKRRRGWGAIDTVKSSGREDSGIQRLFVSSGGQTYSRSASLPVSPFIFNTFFSSSPEFDWSFLYYYFSSWCEFAVVQYVICHIGSC